MLRVRVCAAHIGGFLGPKFSKQGSLLTYLEGNYGTKSLTESQPSDQTEMNLKIMENIVV